MKVTAVVRTVGMNDDWTEVYEIPRDGDSAQDVIDKFNRSLRQGELPRELVSSSEKVDVELLLIGHSETVTLPTDRIHEFFQPSYGLQDFLKDAKLGSMFDISEENDSHFQYAVIVLEGSGSDIGIEADLPTTEAESCNECDNGEPDDMVWEEGGWKCTKCGAVQ